MTLATQGNELISLLEFVINSTQSSFYRDRYKECGIVTEKDISNLTLKELPILTWNDIKAYPFPKRIYTTDNLVVKIDYHKKTKKPLLIGRTRNDLKEERFGEILNRPLLLFEDVYEGIEKGLWYYEYGVLPAISEKQVETALLIAQQYQADSVMGDPHALEKFIYCSTPSALKHLRHINVVGDSFILEKVRQWNKRWSLSFTIALPEVGTIAHGCSQSLRMGRLLFHTDEKTLIEYGEMALVTRLVRLPTPIIRYRTSLRARLVEKTCSCDANETFSLL